MEVNGRCRTPSREDKYEREDVRVEVTEIGEINKCSCQRALGSECWNEENEKIMLGESSVESVGEYRSGRRRKFDYIDEEEEEVLKPLMNMKVGNLID